MRCASCNTVLTDFEATRKYKNTQHYVDLCNKCFKSVEDVVPTQVRFDLMYNTEDEEFVNDE